MTQLFRPVDPHVTEAFVECHAEGHQWRPVGKLDPSQAEPGLRAPSWASSQCVGRLSQCVNCGGERVRWYTRSGEVVPRYRHREGYLHKREAGDTDPAPTRQDWRKRLVISLFDDLGTPEVQQPKRGRRA